MKIKKIKGRVYNISLNQKRIQKGWYLIVTEDGQEYLVRRNRSSTSKSWFGIYQSKHSMKEYIMIQQPKGTFGASLGLAIVTPALVRSLTPFDLWLDPINRSGDVFQGSLNLLWLLGSLSLALLIIAFYRKKKLEFFLNQKSAPLKYVGKVRAESPLVVSKKGIGFW